MGARESRGTRTPHWMENLSARRSKGSFEYFTTRSARTDDRIAGQNVIAEASPSTSA